MDALSHDDQPRRGTPEARHTSPDSPPVQPRLDIQSPADCLQLVRHTFGGIPAESLIVIGLRDGHTGGHMRVDLRPALVDPYVSVRLIAECLAGEGAEPVPEAALVMLIGAEPDGDSQQSSWQACLAALGLLLESEYCVRMVQVWFVAGDTIRDPRGAEEGGRTPAPHSVSDLMADAAHPDGVLSADRRARPLERAAALFLSQAPAPDAEIRNAVEQERRQRAERLSPLQAQRLLLRWDAALEEVSPEAPSFTAEVVTRLLEQLRSGPCRDLLIPLATLGLPAAMLGLRVHSSPGASWTDPDQHRLLEDYAASFLGETGRRPDWERVDSLELVLQRLVPYAEGAERENLLCLMAWIEWSRGRGTAAGAFIDQCLQEFPQNQFSALIERLMQLKGVCAWARVKKHSWSWTRSQAESKS
ncbi:DUF4192 family protein [Nesterenkonia lutea]|uniref:DUF4192 family protein n=1 Tax=Nesterenkonia lutea TaxID=272919 RepID=A0ABR9JD40_9MICC|nr:DUF4192 family protein [Nesterenkonia lutea]MBE1523849.1 hypothetical protein [Nesterenkonia lutea]